MRQRRFSFVFVIGMAILGIGGGLVISSGLSMTPAAPAAEIWEEGKADTPYISGTMPDFVKLAKDLNPTVVNVFTTKIIKHPEVPSPLGPPGQRNPFEDFFGPHGYERFFGQLPPMEQRSLGSGFIIGKGGYILTNNHVVEGADEVRVKLADNRDFKAKVIGRDEKTDIALIKIDVKGDLPVARLGDSDKIEVGEWVMAIGNPFGLGHTVTKGIISAKARIIGAGPYDNFLQTDAPINQGNSGGPLFNGREEAVGINTAIMAAPAQGIGFAIPINMAKEVLPQLKERGKVVRGWLGVEIQAVTPNIAEALDLKDARGALVARVEKGSPADKAGLKEKDIIVEFNGKKIGEYNELPNIVALTPVGTEAKLTVIRDGKSLTLQAKVRELSEKRVAEKEVGKEEQGGALGLVTQEITPDLVQQYNLQEEKGVAVTKIVPGGLADAAGIHPGDIILEVNRMAIHSMKDYRSALEKGSQRKPVLFLLQRGEGRIFVAVQRGS